MPISPISYDKQGNARIQERQIIDLAGQGMLFKRPDPRQPEPAWNESRFDLSDPQLEIWETEKNFLKF